MQHTVRVWDLPTRLFHWATALAVIALVVTAKLDAMTQHMQLGLAMLALLAFRLIWGLAGGRWSRFTSFLYSPGHVWRYLRGAQEPDDGVGHSPLGALSVFGLLALLGLQVASGLLSDDQSGSAGPLARFVSDNVVDWATWYHADVGQYLLYALVGLHLLAIMFYTLALKRALVRPMLLGDKQLERPAKPSRDDLLSRALALLALALSGALACWVARLG